MLRQNNSSFVFSYTLQYSPVTVHGTMLQKPLGAMVSSPDQTPQAPVMLIIIIHYIERPAPSVRLVKSIHLRALPQYWLIRELQPLQPLDKDIDIFYDAFIK